MISARIMAALALTLFSASVAVTEDQVVGQKPPAKLQVRSLSPSGPAGQLIGKGVISARSKNWPATFLFDDAAGNPTCTSTAVGSRVILVAAHCIVDEAEGSVSTGPPMDLTVTDVKCYHHPKYAPNVPSADFALCLTAEPLPPPRDGYRDVEFETINTDASLFPSGSRLTLVGYGCRQTKAPIQNFAGLFEGEAVIRKTPSDAAPYLMTEGDTAVCSGDSGGGSYGILNPTSGSRRIVGVNSVGDLSRKSWIAATATTNFQSWAKPWAIAHAVEICGINASTENCRP
jgi:hypothetical protein